jgi:hypothetical protein
MMKLNFSMEELYKGCLLMSIANAIFIASAPDMEFFHSWDGINYNQNSGSGSRGTVSFTDGFCVGAFRNEECNSAWLHDIYEGKKTAFEYFQNASENIQKLAKEETLQYLFDYTENGEQPVITTAFWGNGEGLF